MDELSGSVARSVAWVFPQNLGNLGARRVEFLASRSPPQENRKNEATCVTHGGADDGRRDGGRKSWRAIHFIFDSLPRPPRFLERPRGVVRGVRNGQCIDRRTAVVVRAKCMRGGSEGETEHITQRNAVGGRAGGPLTEGTKGEKSEIGSVGAEKKRRGARTVLPVSPS